MGALQTKSPLERRNTIARRSQRRTLITLKPKIAKINKEIKKFKGIIEDKHYQEIKREIEILKNELSRRGRDLQPQIRDLYENIYKSLSEAELALQDKLEENKQKNDKKNQQQQNEQENSIVSDNCDPEITSNISQQETVVQVHHENQQMVQDDNKQEHRKTVQLKVVKVVDEEGTISPSKNPISPTDKRKSILKVGVPVMPGAVLDELAHHPNRMTRFYDISDEQKPTQNSVDRIKEIINELGQLEAEIANFVGKKNGVQYNKISQNLDKYKTELHSIQATDEYTVDQLTGAVNYINSCVRFLEEKATDHSKGDTVGDDDVFENNNEHISTNVANNFKLQQLLKNTPV